MKVTETRSASIKEFVRRLSTKGSDDIEKLLIHVLDVAQVRWNEKATSLLRESKKPNLPAERVRELTKEYSVAFNNVQRILRMRHGVGISKRVF